MRFDSATASPGEWCSISSARRNGRPPSTNSPTRSERGFARADQQARDQRGQRVGVQHVVAQVVERRDLPVRHRDDVAQRMRDAGGVSQAPARARSPPAVRSPASTASGAYGSRDAIVVSHSICCARPRSSSAWRGLGTIAIANRLIGLMTTAALIACATSRPSDGVRRRAASRCSVALQRVPARRLPVEERVDRQRRAEVDAHGPVDALEVARHTHERAERLALLRLPLELGDQRAALRAAFRS